MKAADIPDTAMLYYVASSPKRNSAGWVMLWDMQHAPIFAQFPPKVVLAKARALLKRGLLSGCGCGCRGDFTVTEKGMALMPAQHVNCVTDLPSAFHRMVPL